MRARRRVRRRSEEQACSQHATERRRSGLESRMLQRCLVLFILATSVGQAASVHVEPLGVARTEIATLIEESGADVAVARTLDGRDDADSARRRISRREHDEGARPHRAVPPRARRPAVARRPIPVVSSSTASRDGTPFTLDAPKIQTDVIYRRSGAHVVSRAGRGDDYRQQQLGEDLIIERLGAKQIDDDRGVGRVRRARAARR